MKLVGAGCHVECDRALPQPVLRFKGRAVDADLAHRLVGRINIGLVTRELDKHHWDAIELSLVLVGDAAIDIMSVSSPLHAGSKKHKGVDLPRQAADFDGSVLYQFG